MNNIVERLKKDTNNVFDIIYRKISIDNKSIYIIFSDTLSDVNYINNYILKKLLLFLIPMTYLIRCIILFHLLI